MRGWSPEAPARGIPSPPRLAIRTPVVPREIVPRLLACPGVGSVVLPVFRPPGATRARSWHWPLRIGVADDLLRDALSEGRQNGPVPAAIVEIIDVRDDPSAVDLLALRGSTSAAADFLTSSRCVANAVICVAPRTEPWDLEGGLLSIVRERSGSVLTAIGAPSDPSPGTDAQEADAAARALLLTVRYFAHAHPIDVALTAAFDRNILITAEVESIADAALPEIVRTRARQVRRDFDAVSDSTSLLGGEQIGDRPSEDVIAELDTLAGGVFDHESGEATRAAELAEQIEAALDEAESGVPRVLQARIGPGEGPPDNLLRAGINVVDVFIGAIEAGALQGEAVPDAALGFDDPSLDIARVTVVLAPLEPPGEAVRGELDVPRFGRSPGLRLPWELPDSGLVQARLLLLHRNRVLQTARITGRVGGEAELDDRIVLWDRTGRLNDRTAFDRTFVLNHDMTGRSRVVSHADGVTTIQALDEIGPPADRIRDHLIKATQLTSTGKRAEEASRKILIDVAIEGHDLYDLLADHLERFVDAKRIQIVTARSGRFLPLELIYHRQAPALDATLCENWVQGSECGDHCFAAEDDISVVCPSVFWGMSRTIERQHASIASEDGNAFVVSVTPTRNRRTLKVGRSILAASRKVRPVDVGKTAVLIGAAARAENWNEWTTALSATPTDLLVLMPHTDPKAGSLEISGETLRTGQIEARHVTGGQAVTPVVLLLGCDTDGSQEDPAGYATRFLAKGAAVVFSTLTMLLGRHAAAMSQRLAQVLKDPALSGRPLGDVVTRFRREALRAGLISALAVTAYGDADWRI